MLVEVTTVVAVALAGVTRTVDVVVDLAGMLSVSVKACVVVLMLAGFLLACIVAQTWCEYADAPLLAAKALSGSRYSASSA